MLREQYNEAARAECSHMTREELLDRIGFLFMRQDRLTADRYRLLDDLVREPTGDSSNAP